MGSNNEPENKEMTAGQARRLEKKKAAEAAKAKEKNMHIFTIVGAVLALAIIIYGIVVGITSGLGKTKAVTDYSQNLTKDGKIKDINVDEYINALDYNNFLVSYFDIQADEEKIIQQINELCKDYVDADENGDEIEATFNDEFALTFLGMTADEYQTKLRREEEDRTLRSLIADRIGADSVLIKVPEKYLDTIKGIYKASDMDLYNQYNNAAFQQTGEKLFDSFESFTGYSNEDYEAELERRALLTVTDDLAAQSIFEKAGLTITSSEYKDFVDSFGGDIENQYGKGYVMKNLIHEKVVEFLAERAKIENSPY